MAPPIWFAICVRIYIGPEPMQLETHIGLGQYGKHSFVHARALAHEPAMQVGTTQPWLPIPPMRQFLIQCR